MATKTITVKKGDDGELIIDPPEITLIQDRDKVKVRNRAELTVFWQVPDGPLVGAPFNKRVFLVIPSAEHKAKPHDKRTSYAYQITSDQKKRRAQKSDPIIIIDIEKRKKARPR